VFYPLGACWTALGMKLQQVLRGVLLVVCCKGIDDSFSCSKGKLLMYELSVSVSLFILVVDVQ